MERGGVFRFVLHLHLFCLGGIGAGRFFALCFSSRLGTTPLGFQPERNEAQFPVDVQFN